MATDFIIFYLNSKISRALNGRELLFIRVQTVNDVID